MIIVYFLLEPSLEGNAPGITEPSTQHASSLGLLEATTRDSVDTQRATNTRRPSVDS